MKKYIVRLTQPQRQFFTELTHAHTATTRMQVRARIFLKADQGEHGPAWHDQQIIEALEVGHATVERVRMQFVQGGLEAALFPRSASKARPRKLDGEQEAHLISVCCRATPTGRKRWSLRLLAARLVELEIVEQISHETVRQVRKKISENRGRRNSGVFLPSRVRSLSPIWKTFWKCTSDLMIQNGLKSVWMKSTRNCSKRNESRLNRSWEKCGEKMTNTPEKGFATCRLPVEP